MRIARRAGVLAAAVALAATLGGPAAGQSSPTPEPEPVTFVVGVTGDLNSVNIFRQIDSNESFVSGLMYDGLLRLGQKDYTPEGELADRWVVSEDGLTWTFHIRDGVTWSDGVPITADDFVWTSNFIIDHDISSWSDGYRFTESIEAADDQTIVWTTTRPTLIPGLPGYNLILPKHIWGEFTEQELKDFKNFPNPVGSGPFELVEWEQGEYWRMEARNDYWQGRAKIDEILFRVYNTDESVVQALISGAIDYTSIPTAALYNRVNGQPGIATAVDSAEAFWHLSFNVVDDPKSTAHPAVLQQTFRQAVANAIDRPTLIDRVVRGYATPGSTPIAPVYDYWHWEPPPDVAYGFDLAKANRILDDAGYADTDGDGVREMPGGGEPLRLRLFLWSGDSDGVKAAPFIREWLGEIGVEASVKTFADTKLYDLWYGFDWDMIIYSWGTDPDPDFLLSTFTSGQCGYWSDTCYDNPEYDDLYQEQQTTLDREQRREIVFEMQQKLYEDAPQIVLWYPNSFEAWRGDRWTGFLHWPEPDGVVFWGNSYSARSVERLSSGGLARAEGGPPGFAWLIGATVLVLALVVSTVRRRRLDGYYA